MKNKALRTLSFAVILSVLLGMLPSFAVAAEEVTYSQGDTFEFEGNSYEVLSGSVTLTDETVYGNSDQKIKFNNTENITSSIKTTLIPRGLSNKMLIASDFAVTALTPEEGSEEQGLKMHKIRSTGLVEANSGYFTNVSYKFWRKMGLTDSSCNSSVVTFSFSGIGTAFLKNIRLESGAFVNLDFSALKAEGEPADWTFNGSLVIDTSDKDAKWWHLVETENGNYMETNGLTRANWIRSSIQSGYLKNKGIYRVSVNAIGNLGFDTRLDSLHAGYLPHGDVSTGTSYGTWVKKTSDWSVKSCTMINGTLSGKENFYIQFRPHNETYTKIKDVKFEEVTDSFSIVHEDGNPVESLRPGKVTVSYEKPLTDIAGLYVEKAADLTLDMVNNGLYSDTKVSLLAGLYKETENGKILVDVNISTDNRATVSCPKVSVVTSDATDVGIICPKASATFDIPNDGGTYSIQYMAWDSASGLNPSGTLFTFPAPVAE